MRFNCIISKVKVHKKERKNSYKISKVVKNYHPCRGSSERDLQPERSEALIPLSLSAVPLHHFVARSVLMMCSKYYVSIIMLARSYIFRKVWKKRTE